MLKKEAEQGVGKESSAATQHGHGANGAGDQAEKESCCKR
jgi:hypothetical protein